MKLWDNSVRYLSNARFICDGIDVEEDLIVIAPTGVFSIEIKNWKKDAIINQNGILVSKSGKGKSIDIINQVKRHCFCLRMILNQVDILSEELEQNKEFIHPIILWQNELSELKDEFHRIPICCANTLEYEILDYTKYSKCFSDKDIEKVYKILESQTIGERKYPLVIRDELIDLFLATVKEEMNKNREYKRLKNNIYKLEHPIKSRMLIIFFGALIAGTILEEVNDHI